MSPFDNQKIKIDLKNAWSTPILCKYNDIDKSTFEGGDNGWVVTLENGIRRWIPASSVLWVEWDDDVIKFVMQKDCETISTKLENVDREKSAGFGGRNAFPSLWILHLDGAMKIIPSSQINYVNEFPLELSNGEKKAY